MPFRLVEVLPRHQQTLDLYLENAVMQVRVLLRRGKENERRLDSMLVSGSVVLLLDERNGERVGRRITELGQLHVLKAV